MAGSFFYNFPTVFSTLFLKQSFLYSFFLYLTQKILFFHAGEENTLTVTINIITLLSYTLVFTFLSRINSSNLCCRINSSYIKVEERNLIYFKIRSVFPGGETEEQSKFFITFWKVFWPACYCQCCECQCTGDKNSSNIFLLILYSLYPPMLNLQLSLENWYHIHIPSIPAVRGPL